MLTLRLTVKSILANRSRALKQNKTVCMCVWERVWERERDRGGGERGGKRKLWCVFGRVKGVHAEWSKVFKGKVEQEKLESFLKLLHISFSIHNPKPSLYPFLYWLIMHSVYNHLIHRIIAVINFNSMCKRILCQWNTLDIMSYFNCLEECQTGLVCAIFKGFILGMSPMNFGFVQS